LTAPRLAVLADVANAGDQFSAEEIAARLRGRSIGRATVFRTLKLLVEAGVLCRVLLDDGTLRYRWSRRGHHHHLVCTECGSVQDFTACDVPSLVQELSRQAEFTVDGHWLEVYGRCAVCHSRTPELAATR
jgi:Fur family ferric uptake transcriptional regulator